MCLALLVRDCCGPHSLLVALNRDEFYQRRTLAARRWSDRPDIVGGLDLRSGGSWLAVSAAGRLALVTNYRSGAPRKGHKSRGSLVKSFVEGASDPQAFITAALADRRAYGDFNLVVFRSGSLYCASSANNSWLCVGPGIHGLSNGDIDEPWPKVERAKGLLGRLLSADWRLEQVVALMRDDAVPADDSLPDTGVGLPVERVLAPIFIRDEAAGYGTRSTTAVLWRKSLGFELIERSYDAAGRASDSCYRL